MNLRTKLFADYYLGGIVHIAVKPFVILLGTILKRDHTLNPARLKELTVIKMLGGGSLLIAYPSLLALKRKYPALKLNLVTTPAIKPFADLMGLFDKLILIRDDNFIHLAFDTINAIRFLWCAPDLLDLEIHSRFSAVFTLLTCAYNRIGIYTDLSFGRRSLYTHLLFYNKYSAIHLLYDQVVRLLGVDEIDFSAAKAEFLARTIPRAGLAIDPAKTNIGIAAGCSDYGKERMLTVEHWGRILTARISAQESATLHFIGSPSDREFCDHVISHLKSSLPNTEFANHCGRYSLSDSIALIKGLKMLYCIDSSLLHFARLLDVKTVSFWGPTDPRTRLRPDAQLPEETNYEPLSCSPCIHITMDTPCYGNNICMNAAVDLKNYTGERNPIWLAK